MILHLAGSVLFLVGGGVAIYRGRWWSRQGFDIHVMYGTHSHRAETRRCDPGKTSWCLFLFCLGAAAIALGLWQLAGLWLSR